MGGCLVHGVNAGPGFLNMAMTGITAISITGFLGGSAFLIWQGCNGNVSTLLKAGADNTEASHFSAAATPEQLSRMPVGYGLDNNGVGFTNSRYSLDSSDERFTNHTDARYRRLAPM